MIRLFEKYLPFGVLLLFLCTWKSAFAKEVTIKWEPLEHAVQYEILIQQKGNEALRQRLHSAKTEWKAELPNGFYVYQLRAIDRTDRPGNWTEIHPLAVLPPAPRPASPGDGAVVSLLQAKDGLNLEWSPVKGADKYFVKITSGESILYAGSVSDTKKSLNSLRAGNYQWEVQSVVVADDKSPQTLRGREWNTTDGVSQSFTLRYTELSAPTLVSPANSALLTQRDLNLRWKKVKDAEAYEVRITRLNEGSGSRSLAGGSENLREAYVTKDPSIDIHLPENGRYQWKVRSLARIDENKKPGVVSNASVGSFLLDPYPSPARKASLAFGYFATPNEYKIESPTGSTALGQSSVASTLQLKGQYALSQKWTLEAGAEESFWKMGGGTDFSKFGLVLDTSYQIPLGGGTREWIFTSAVGIEDRDNRELMPAANDTADPNSPPIHALGPDISLELRKVLGPKTVIGAKLTYFMPVRVFVPRYGSFASFSGPPSPEVSYQNWGADIYALFWLAPQWGISFEAAARNNEISFHQDAQLYQIQMNELRFGASLIFGWGG